MFLKISKILLYASVFCVVIVIADSFFPFIGGKYDFFRVATELSLISLLIFWAWEDKKGVMKSRWKALTEKPLFLAVSAFLLFYMLSCLFAHDIHAAFWSNFERGEGGFQMLHYYLFFVLAGLLLKSEEDWKWIFRVSLAAAVCMILYGVAGALPISGFVGPYAELPPAQGPTFWARLVSSGTRFQGSLGNPAYVAPYILFSIFYALYLWITAKKQALWKHIGFGALIVFFLFFFWLSGTRGAFLGLVAAVFSFIVFLIFRKATRKAGAITLGILAVCTALMFGFRNTPLVENLPGSRVLFISVSDDSAQTRLWTWNSAWKGFVERPLFGWGPENFSTVFDKYFDPRHFIPNQNSETWFDRAHSIVFDYLAENGIFTFLAYFSIFALFYITLFKRRGKLPNIERHTGSGVKEIVREGLLLALPVGYLVQGIVLFDVLPIYLNVFLFMGFATFLLYPSAESHAPHIPS